MDLAARLGAWVLTNRRLVRAPIPLYRHGLGRLLGSRVLMLEHLGRTSGEPRYVCLEVVERPTPELIVVVSGFGRRSQWYRNLTAQPHCHVSTGRLRRVDATARLLDDDESTAVVDRYRAARPRDWERLEGAIARATGRPVGTLPAVELRLA